MDGVFKSEAHYQEHTGVMTNRLTQPSEDIILHRNAELRKNPGSMHELGAQSEGGVWGRHLCCIPFITYEQAKRDGFELDCKDTQHAEKELYRFLKTPAGAECLSGQ